MLGLNASQPPRQNCADDNDKENGQFSSACRLWSEIVTVYNRPFSRLRPPLCLAQRSFPLLLAVVPGPLLCKDGVGSLEGAMRLAMEAGCVHPYDQALVFGICRSGKEGAWASLDLSRRLFFSLATGWPVVVCRLQSAQPPINLSETSVKKIAKRTSHVPQISYCMRSFPTLDRTTLSVGGG